MRDVAEDTDNPSSHMPWHESLEAAGIGMTRIYLSGSFLSCSFGSFFSESGTRSFRQMHNRPLSPCSLRCLLNIPLRSGALSSSCHIFYESVTGIKDRSRVFDLRAPQVCWHLSAGASACALPSSRQRSATVQSVASPRALRVSTTLALTLTGGSRA